MEPGQEPPLLAFAEVMRRLRAECPWKAAQTHRSLARYLLEETHETLEAIETGDQQHLREELGDLLLQVYFHAVIAEESGAFTLDDVASDITAKMVRRNPHVFGDASAEGLDPAAVNELWEAVKAGEKQRTSVTDGIAPTLPALLYADKVLDRLERAGAPAVVPGEAAPDEEGLGEDGPDEEGLGVEGPAEEGLGVDRLGDRLLALVVEARGAGGDPEQALRDAVRRLVAKNTESIE